MGLSTIKCLDIGAGDNPHPDATVTLDYATHLPHIDHPGIDITSDRWPFDDNTVERVICQHVIEHLPRNELTNVWKELYRVLAPGGTAQFVTPHAGTYSAERNPGHEGCGGFTLDLAVLLNDDNRNTMKGEFPEWPTDWTVNAKAVIDWPTFIRPSLRPTVSIHHRRLAHDLAKFPFADGTLILTFEK